MKRYRTAYPQDDESARDGDTGFLGVNAKAAAERLEAGYVRSAENFRFRDGVAFTREGITTPSFARAANFTDVFAGGGIFSDPFGLEWLLLASGNDVWQVRAGHSPRSLGTPGRFGAGDYCEFVQAFNQVLIFRGSENIPWVWDGSAGGAFVNVDQSVSSDETSPIPNGPDRAGLRPVLLNNRLIVPHGRTSIAVSDLLDFTRFDADFADFDVTTGNDDTLTALYPFTRETVLCFKDQSIAAVSGIGGTLAPQLDVINREIGCVAGKSVAMVGGDVFFLSGQGVFRVQEIVQERLQAQPVAVSDPIAPIIQRIYWPAVGKACAAVLGEYYYLAVPIDGSTINNAILPYNSATGAWEGIHTFPAGLDSLRVSDWFSARVLYAIDNAASRVRRLYLGRSDIADVNSEASDERQIAADLLTRGYTLGDNGLKRFRRSQVAVETWNPEFTIAAEMDGVNETRTLLDSQTRSRVRYWTDGVLDYDPSNTNDDHATPGREDYSINLADEPIPNTGMALNLHQAVPVRGQINRKGRWCSLRVSTAQGSARVTSIEVQGDETQRAQRSVAA